MSAEREALRLRATFLFPKVLEALADPTRREILSYLLDAGERVSFGDLRAHFSPMKKRELEKHLNLLQQAALVQRWARYGGESPSGRGKAPSPQPPPSGRGRKGEGGYEATAFGVLVVCGFHHALIWALGAVDELSVKEGE